jgi:hypothetical protein
LSRLFDRQFADEDKQVYSLHAFLLDVRRSHQLVSREHYVGAANQDADDETPEVYNFHRFNMEFDAFVGKGKSCISKEDVNMDLKDLRKAMKNLNAYRNKTLAHNAVVKSTTPVKYVEINEAVHTMNKLIYKYYLLIKRSSHTLNLPEPDITKLFMMPWIADKKAREAIIADYDKWIKQKRKKV